MRLRGQNSRLLINDSSLGARAGHLGWHLPFIKSPEPHDFHHSLNGGRNLNNLGQLGVLDGVFGTEKEWLKAWQRDVDKTYSTPDYPVEKTLAQEHAAEQLKKAEVNA